MLHYLFHDGCRRKKMKRYIGASFLLLLLMTSFCAAQTGGNDIIYTDIGLGMNYSVMDQTAFLAPKLGLGFLLTDEVMADISFGFETHSVDYDGIQKDENQYFSIDLLGKYFLTGGFWAGAGFGYAMFLNSSTTNAAPDTPGELHTDLLRFLISVGYLSEILDRIYLDPSLLFRFVIPTEESDTFDIDIGLYFTVALGIMRR
jgi:hypothetical protein